MSVKSMKKSGAIGNQDIVGLAAELVDVWNAHDVDHAVSYYAADYEGIDVAAASPQRGPEGIRQTMTGYLQAFPDLQFTPETSLVDGSRIAVVWTATGTHQGRLMNIPPTGRQIQVRGVSVLTLDQGKVKHALYIWDVAGLLRGIGLLPDL